MLLLLIPAVIAISTFLTSAKSVNNRILLQTKADCIASSAATWLAAGLNDMAECNLTIEVLGAILEESNSSSATLHIKSGKKALIEAEIRRVERTKTEILKQIPINIAEHARNIDRKSIIANTNGIIDLPIEGDLLNQSLCRLVSFSPGNASFAIASKTISSIGNTDGTKPLVPDFNPEWCAAQLSSSQFDLFRSRYPRETGAWTLEKLNNELLH
jgi:hypothetical protein